MTFQNKLLDEFGSDPFLFDNSSIVYETDRPYKKGEFINYLGSSYLCQGDIGSRKKILLVKDGLVAIPESLSPSADNERTILSRQVSLEPLIIPDKNLPTGIWGLDAYYDFFPKSAYFFYQGRKKGDFEVVLDTKQDIARIDYGFIYVDPVKKKKEDYSVYSFFYGSGEAGRRFVNGARKEDTPWVAENILLDFNSYAGSICNAWIWNPGSRKFENQNDTLPVLRSGYVGDFSKNEWVEAISGTYNGNFSEPPNTLNYTSTTGFSGEIRHLPNVKPTTLTHEYIKNVSTEFDVNGNSIRTITTSNELTYSKPKIADYRKKKVIAYDVDNAKVTTVVEDNTENFTLNKENSHSAYLYDYSSDPQSPTKTKVNSHNSFSINLYASGTSGISSNLKSDYEIGDTITYTFSGGVNAQGFYAVSGTINTNSKTYSGSIVSDQFSNYLSESQVPIENAWGWLPTDDDFVVGIKAKITSLNTTATNTYRDDLALVSSLSTVNRFEINSVTFEILEILTPKISFDIDIAALTSPSNQAGDTQDFGAIRGKLQYGKSFLNLNYDFLDHPLNYLFNENQDVTDCLGGFSLEQDMSTNKYWWEGDYIWHLKVYFGGIGNFLGYITSPNNKLYIERFKLVFNEDDNQYDVIFDGWDEFSPSESPIKKEESGDIFFYDLNDITIVAPKMTKP